MNSQLLIVIAVIVFGLTMATSAAQASFFSSRKGRLVLLGETIDVDIAPTLALLEDTRFLRPKLLIIHTFMRFILFGLIVAAFYPQNNPTAVLWYLMIAALAAGFVVALLDSLVEVSVNPSPEMWAVRLTGLTRLTLAIFSPIWLLPVLLLRALDRGEEEPVIDAENELMTLLEATHEDGGLEEDERDMIRSVFQLRDTTVREIMVPRIDMLALNITTPLNNAIDQLLESGYSRVPVYEDSVDRTIGILYVKDLLHLVRTGVQSGSLHDITRPPYFVPESKKVDDLLADMQREHIHIAMVVDEYGGVAGLVTLEDIVEELVGEIQDEYDKAEEELYQIMDDGSIMFQARIDLDDFNDILESDLPNDDADTLGGLIYSLVGQIPKGGEVLEVDGLRLTVEQVMGRRIRKVRVQQIANQDEQQKEEISNDKERTTR